MFRTSARILLPVLLVFATSLAASAASREAEAYMQNVIDRGVALARSGEKTRFHDFVVQHIDARRAALFALGRYRRGASEADISRYVDAFRDYATALYERRLHERSAEELTVVGSVENKPGDFTVSARTRGGSSEGASLAFRVIRGSSGFRVVDVQVEGVWLSVEQRDQFASFLSKNGGDVTALAEDLRRRATAH